MKLELLKWIPAFAGMTDESTYIMQTTINIFLSILGIYFAVGFLFGLYFLFKGATKIDPLMQDTKKKVRVLLFPGVVATWPFLIGKLFKSKTV